MESYDWDMYGGSATETLDSFIDKHPTIVSLIVFVGIIVIILLVIMLVYWILSLVMGWGKSNTDSFLGSYLRWTPSLQNSSEWDGAIGRTNANYHPGGILKEETPENLALINSNLGCE